MVKIMKVAKLSEMVLILAYYCPTEICYTAE
jgi:hypothetical protein